MCPDVILPMITYDIKKNLPALSIERRRSRNAVVGGRDLRYTQVPQPRTHTTPVARWNIARTSLHFDIPGPEAPTRRTSLSLSLCRDRDGRGGPARVLSFYYIASGRGEADAQLFMPVSRPIERIGHIRIHTYHVYVHVVKYVCTPYVLRGDAGDVGERTSRAFALRILFPRNHMPHSSLRAPPLCFFVRAKIINGQTEARYPEVSASWQWRSSHFESPPFRPFLLHHFSHHPRTSTVRHRVRLRLTP